MKNNKYPQLDKINSPNDLKKLDNSQLKELSDEIRSYILEVISQTGGHLAAGLGTVELSISLHYVFNTPTRYIERCGYCGFSVFLNRSRFTPFGVTNNFSSSNPMVVL